MKINVYFPTLTDDKEEVWKLFRRFDTSKELTEYLYGYFYDVCSDSDQHIDIILKIVDVITDLCFFDYYYDDEFEIRIVVVDHGRNEIS